MRMGQVGDADYASGGVTLVTVDGVPMALTGEPCLLRGAKYLVPATCPHPLRAQSHITH